MGETVALFFFLARKSCLETFKNWSIIDWRVQKSSFRLKEEKVEHIPPHGGGVI